MEVTYIDIDKLSTLLRGFSTEPCHRKQLEGYLKVLRELRGADWRKELRSSKLEFFLWKCRKWETHRRFVWVDNRPFKVLTSIVTSAVVFFRFRRHRRKLFRRRNDFNFCRRNSSTVDLIVSCFYKNTWADVDSFPDWKNKNRQLGLLLQSTNAKMRESDERGRERWENEVQVWESNFAATSVRRGVTNIFLKCYSQHKTICWFPLLNSFVIKL